MMIGSFPCCCLRRSPKNEADLRWIYLSMCISDLSTALSFSSHMGHRCNLKGSALLSSSAKTISNGWMTSSRGSFHPRLIPSKIWRHTLAPKAKLLPQSLITLQSIRLFSTRPNYYEILDIKQNATFKDIRSAFLKQSKKCHPDLNKGDPSNHTKFVCVNEAYSVLRKPGSRRDYDLTLASGSMSSPHVGNSSNIHRPNAPSNSFYDPHFYAHRDRSQDKYYSENSYYGVEGIPKKTNQKIFVYCLIFMCVGVLIQAGVVISSYGIYNGNYRPRHGKQVVRPGIDSLKPVEDNHGRIR